jgi:hypothetical protein
LVSFRSFSKDKDFLIGKQAFLLEFLLKYVFCTNVEVKRVVENADAQRLRLCVGGILEFLLPGTVAKFIIKSSL